MLLSHTKISYNQLDQLPGLPNPQSDLTIVVVIPSFAEASLLPVLHSLKDCEHPQVSFEIIIIINESESVIRSYQEVNEKAFDELSEFENDKLHICCIYVKEIPDKIAGVGTARRIGMEMAYERIEEAGNLETGIIVNLDVDCTVSSNYLREIHNYFNEYSKIELSNIHFEHNLKTASSLSERRAIIDYELHLRYFIGMQKWLGLPYAFQTIGSAFAVRPIAYKQVGGMNKRKAGEDFYFIHKFTKKGTAGNLQSCSVFPSSRESFRVPFGTGKAVKQLLKSEEELLTYHPSAFVHLSPLLKDISELYKNGIANLSEYNSGIRSYLEKENFAEIILKLRSNSTVFSTFQKAFFQWFDAFRLMKYLHHNNAHYCRDIPISEAVNRASNYLGIPEIESKEEQLNWLRRNY